jgi:uncharacterized protein YjbJ (UPF0337 family)
MTGVLRRAKESIQQGMRVRSIVPSAEKALSREREIKSVAASQPKLARITRRRSPMGSKTDQIKGYANKATGKVRQGIGKAIGNDRMRAKGAAQEVKGEAQKAMGKVKGAVKGAADKVADKAHKKL